jgi:hypothetical protein
MNYCIQFLSYKYKPISVSYSQIEILKDSRSVHKIYRDETVTPTVSVFASICHRESSWASVAEFAVISIMR